MNSHKLPIPFCLQWNSKNSSFLSVPTEDYWGHIGDTFVLQAANTPSQYARTLRDGATDQHKRQNLEQNTHDFWHNPVN
uniref:Uncharacterized protein n=1 Tax=Anguilla anguilla TaxID=7936 RepID=A0A0E9WAT5_ANGAN